jgi:hypothetical protein
MSAFDPKQTLVPTPKKETARRVDTGPSLVNDLRVGRSPESSLLKVNHALSGRRFNLPSACIMLEPRAASLANAVFFEGLGIALDAGARDIMAQETA